MERGKLTVAETPANLEYPLHPTAEQPLHVMLGRGNQKALASIGAALLGPEGEDVLFVRRGPGKRRGLDLQESVADEKSAHRGYNL
jgi:hypothetical protein